MARRMMKNLRRVAIVLFSVWAAGCVPLPDRAPSLREARLPRAGDSIAAVRSAFGAPNVLDDGRYLIYDWGTDRNFVLAAFMGVPAAAVTSGLRFRMRVVSDGQGRVAHAECSADGLTEPQLRSIGCMGGAAIRGANKRLADIPALRDATFWSGGGSFGAHTDMALSPDGRFLAASDADNRTWVIDVDGFAVIGRHDGKAGSLLSLTGTPEPRAAFSADGRRLLIAQGDATTLLVLENGRFVAGPPISVGLRAARFTCCPPGIVGLGAQGVVGLGPDGSVRARSAEEGRIAFGPRGAERRRGAGGGPLLLAALSSSATQPDPRAAFGLGHAVLDTRNGFARREGAANYAFSPDGRWLARNACRHVELWRSDVLAGLLNGAGPASVRPERAMMIGLARRSEELDGCPGAVAFSPNGKRIAAASRRVIQVWDMDDDRRQVFLDVDAQAQGMRVSALALDGQRLTAVLSDQPGRMSIARWGLGR